MLLKGAYCVGEHFVDPQCTYPSTSSEETKLRGWRSTDADCLSHLPYMFASIASIID